MVAIYILLNSLKNSPFEANHKQFELTNKRLDDDISFGHACKYECLNYVCNHHIESVEKRSLLQPSGRFLFLMDKCKFEA